MIKIIITGGTIDCERIEGDNEYIYDETHLPQMLEQARCKVDVTFQTLMLKDSLFINDEDRNNILKNCVQCQEDKIIITHGTDTMVETAQLLGKIIKNKTIILLGSMIPYNQDKSDALFNLGTAFSALQALPKGIYITMNGKIFTWDNVRKNKELGVFETLA